MRGYMNKLTINYLTAENFGTIIIDKLEHNNIESKLFFTTNSDTCFCIDNENDIFICEQFDSVEKGLCWLIRSDLGKDYIDKLSTVELVKLLSNENYELVEYKMEQ